MCGILGITGHAISEETLGRAVASLHHRGPDESGLFMDPESPVALGHARLSIMVAGRWSLGSDQANPSEVDLLEI
jgi:asparagine synthase (glutamine-hydrolysing)